MPVYICFAERGCSVSEAAPASTSRGPTSRQAREPFSVPRRIFTDTGRSTASATAETIRARVVGVVEQRRAGAGLRHLPHRAAEVDVDDVGARGLDHPRRLGHRDRGRSRRSGSPAGARRRRRAGSRACARCRAGSPRPRPSPEQTRPGAVAAALAPERLDADACHRRQHEAGRDLDVAEEPGFVKIDLHPASMVAVGLAATSPPKLNCPTISGRHGARFWGIQGVRRPR